MTNQPLAQTGSALGWLVRIQVQVQVLFIPSSHNFPQQLGVPKSTASDVHTSGVAEDWLSEDRYVHTQAVSSQPCALHRNAGRRSLWYLSDSEFFQGHCDGGEVAAAQEE